jgi:hypothetical protein
MLSLKEADMIKLSEKGRKILRAVYRGLGVTAVTLVFHSCDGIGPQGGKYGPAPAYGMPPNYREEIIICGSIISKETGEPIPGIGIWIKDVTTYYADLSASNGEFYLFVPKQDDYTIVFTDIDKSENGGVYKQHTITITREEAESLTENPLIIELEEITEEVTEEVETDEE